MQGARGGPCRALDGGEEPMTGSLGGDMGEVPVVLFPSRRMAVGLQPLHHV